MKFLLDTNIVSEVMRIEPNKHVYAAWERNMDEIALSATTWHELRLGVAQMPASRRRDRFTHFLSDLSERLVILPYDQAAAEWHAEQRAFLVAKGRTPSFQDGQIAAVAAIHELVLVTANTSDFIHFAGLKLENWTKRR